jgi:hypothetical protein
MRATFWCANSGSITASKRAEFSNDTPALNGLETRASGFLQRYACGTK